MKTLIGVIIGMVLMGVVYAAPVMIDSPQMTQRRNAKQLVKQIDDIQNLADVKVYLRKLTKLVASQE